MRRRRVRIHVTPGSGGVVVDAGALLVSRAAQAVLGWTGTLLIVRSLSPNAWGQFTFVFNVLALTFILTSAVGPRTAMRGLIDATASGTGGEFAGSYAILRGLLGVAAYAVTLTLVIAGHYPAAVVRAMAVAGTVIIISSVSAGLSIIFQVNQRMTRWALAQALGQAAQLVLTVVLFVVGASMVVFTIPAILCEIVVIVAVLYWVRPLLRVRATVIFSTWGTLLRTAIPVAIGQGLFAVYNSIDTVMLSKMKSFSAVGEYGIAYKFANIVAMVPFAMTGAIMGTLVRTWPEEPALYWAAFRRAVRLLSMVAVIVTVEFTVFARPIVRLLYGTPYVAAAGAARLIVAAAGLSFFTLLSTVALTSQGRNRPYIVAGACGVAINIAANLFVIPRWSYTGAAWVTLGTELAVLCLVLSVTLKGSAALAVDGRIMMTTVAWGALCFAAAAATDAVMPWSIALAFSGLFACGLLHVLRIPGAKGLGSLLADRDD